MLWHDLDRRITLDIWRKIVENLIDQVKPKAYTETTVYLNKMKRIHSKTQQTGEWKVFRQDLRKRHWAKRRLMKVLDTLSGKNSIG